MAKMTKWHLEVLNLLKKQYFDVNGKIEFQKGRSETEISARNFYVKNLNLNFFEPMQKEVATKFGAGNGNELKDKMYALRSSSAMTYNLFGNDNAFFLDNKKIRQGRYCVEYEKQIYPLKRSNGNRPANLDVFLYNNEITEIIACEMKMCEWLFNSPGKLRHAYLEPENYLYNENEATATFIEVANQLRKDLMTHKEKEYSSKFGRYDAFQMFKHALACYNFCVKEKQKNNKLKKLKLVNCVWELPNAQNRLTERTFYFYESKLNIEHIEFKEFKEIMSPIKDLYKKIDVEFGILYYSFSDFAKIMDLTTARRNYLKRYTF